MPMRISVLICTRDRPDTLGQAVDSVARCDHPSFDLHVMDQSTNDESRRVVERLAADHAARCRIQYHHLSQPGLSRAYNTGVGVSAAPLVACTDDDVVVPDTWLRSIERAFEHDPELGLLYGQVLRPSQMTELGHGIVLPTLEWSQARRLHNEHRNFEVWGMGANMAFRRSTFEQVGGFDEALGGGAPLRSSQDFDFSLRAYRAGYAVLLDPTVTVDHYGSRTEQQWSETMRNYGTGDGAFYAKHVRCGDLLALRLLLASLARAAGSTAKRSVTARRPMPNDYGRGLLRGIRESLRFDVDRNHRLYRETRSARIVATEANSVTGVVRET